MNSNIKSLEEYYKIDMEELLKLYESGYGREEMAEELGIGVYGVRIICSALNLRLKRKHRTGDLNVLRERVTSVTEDGTIQTLSAELDFANKKLFDANKSLVRTRDERNLLTKQLRESARGEAKIDRLEEIFIEAFTNYMPRDAMYTIMQPVHRREDLPVEGLCAVMSDWHIGEEVDAEQVGSEIGYNYMIAEQRVATFVRAIVSHPYQSSELNIMMLADGLKGIIHNGIMESEGSFAESLIKYTEIAYESIKILATMYDSVTVWVTGSNHDRVTEAIKHKDKYADYTYVVFSLVEKMFMEAGITNVNIEQSKTGFHLTNINDANILVLHGDTHRNYKPANQVETAKLQDLSLGLYGEPLKHIISGHNHNPLTAMNTYGGMNIQNGTLVGSNEYGMQEGFRLIRPSQTIFFVDRDGDIEDIKQVIFE